MLSLDDTPTHAHRSQTASHLALLLYSSHSTPSSIDHSVDLPDRCSTSCHHQRTNGEQSHPLRRIEHSEQWVRIKSVLREAH